jgi:L-histidine N-alpha-methyltransferase
MLLDALRNTGTLRRYTAVDVSESALRRAGHALLADYPRLQVRGLVGDFTAVIPPAAPEDGPRLITFLGSTLGNFTPAQRAVFLRRVREAMGPRDSFLVSVDLVKDPDALVAAYDDPAGVMAAFNRNALNVINRHLDADFRPRAFDHVALWNAEAEWIEMHLRSRRVQTVTVKGLDLRLHFAPGQSIRTEISAKFRHSLIASELRNAGLLADQWFSDEENRFNLYLAQPDRPQLTVA